MGMLNKKLKIAIETTSPEKMKDLGELCQKSADTMTGTASILTTASKAFYEGRFADGCALLQKAEDSLSTT